MDMYSPISLQIYRKAGLGFILFQLQARLLWQVELNVNRQKCTDES
jgi:hypothetical protein